MRYRVHYAKPEAKRELLMGFNWPQSQVILRCPREETHVFLKEVEAEGPWEVFQSMQGEVWSPNGEARALIEEKGLWHTSMSVGDLLEDEQGRFFFCDSFGWRELSA